jgi:ribosomal protein S18 acetylase RimI-like enzyme
MNGSDVVIRHARPEDATPIARLHVRTWRETYRHLAPEATVRILDLPYRHAVWVKLLDEGCRTVLVGEIEGSIAAIGTSGPATSPELEPHGEINYLYVDAAMAGRGLGRRMMAALATDLQARGFTSAALGVVAANEAAIAFYERLGGICTGRYTDPGPHWRSENLIYVWTDVAALIDPDCHRRA